MEWLLYLLIASLVIGAVVFWQFYGDNIGSWAKSGPINRSLSETALMMTDAHKSYMECALHIEKEMAKQWADMNAAHARISELQHGTTPFVKDMP